MVQLIVHRDISEAPHEIGHSEQIGRFFNIEFTLECLIWLILCDGALHKLERRYEGKDQSSTTSATGHHMEKQPKTKDNIIYTQAPMIKPFPSRWSQGCNTKNTDMIVWQTKTQNTGKTMIH